MFHCLIMSEWPTQTKMFRFHKHEEGINNSKFIPAEGGTMKIINYPCAKALMQELNEPALTN